MGLSEPRSRLEGPQATGVTREFTRGLAYASRRVNRLESARRLLSARCRHRSGSCLLSPSDGVPGITRSIASQSPSHCLHQSILKEFLCRAQVAQSAL